jgi:hypothetical protein
MLVTIVMRLATMLPVISLKTDRSVLPECQRAFTAFLINIIGVIGDFGTGGWID